MLKCAWHSPYHGEDRLTRGTETVANCTHVQISPEDTPGQPQIHQDLGGLEISFLLWTPRFPFSSILAAVMGVLVGGVSYAPWGLTKKAILIHSSYYCSSVAGRNLCVCVCICLFHVMARRVSEFIFQSKMLIFLLHSAHIICPIICHIICGQKHSLFCGFSEALWVWISLYPVRE